MPSNECVVSISENNTGDTTLFISGSITLHNMDAVLPEIKRLLEDKNLPKIYADLINIDFIDSAGAMLLLQLENELKERSVKLEFINIPDKIRGIMTLLDKNALVSKPIIPDKRSIGSLERIGEMSINFIYDVKDVISFGGELILEIIHALFHPRSVRWTDAIIYMKKVGVDGLPIVGLISFLLGLIIAFMSSLQLKQFGANIYVPSLLSLAMVRELGPIMTAILVAGRSGSAFAAEIGTMKVNEEVDALIIMGFNPVRFLAIPKVFAAIMVVPLLTLFADLFAIIGGLFIGVFFLDLTVYTFVQQSIKAITVFNVVTSMIKAVVLAILIAGIGCQRGFMVRGGAQDVGNATTSAVVAALFLIIVVDSIFAILLNYV